MNSKEYRKCLFLRLIGVVTLLVFISCPSINAQKNPKQVFKIAESAVKNTKVQTLKKMPKASANLRPGAVQGNLYHDFSKREPASANKLHQRHKRHSVTWKVNTRLNAQKPNKASPADNVNVKKKEIEYKPLTAEWDKEWINRIEVEINRVLWLNSVDVEMDSEEYSPPVRINYKIEHNKHTSLIIYNYEYKLYAA